MKQVAQNYKSGELAVLDVPAPVCRPGGVLVRSLFSLISTGTEMMKVAEASLSMVGMARARPDQVKKVIDQVQQQGLATTFARKGADKFADVAWYMDHDAPRLAGKGQWLVCRTDQLITAGDHVIIIGLVVHADTHSFEPLLYRQRAFGTVTHLRS